MFDHLADPHPPPPGATTRAAVARRAERLARRRRAARRALVAVVAVVVLAPVLVLRAAGGGTGGTGLEIGSPGDACCRSIEGVVRNRNGEGVAGVRVQVIDPAAPPARAPLVPTASTPPSGPGWMIVAEAVTDGAGRFHVDDLAGGRYAVRFEDQFDALVGKVRHQPAFLGGAAVLSASRLVDVPPPPVGPAEPAAVVDASQVIDLSPNERLSGSVREDRAPGYPIRDVSVRVFAAGQAGAVSVEAGPSGGGSGESGASGGGSGESGASGGGSGESGELVRQTFTDGNGHWDVGGLGPGNYVVAFLDELPRASGPFAPAWASAGVVTMPGAGDRSVDQRLTRAG